MDKATVKHQPATPRQMELKTYNVAASAETNPQRYVAYRGDGYQLTYEQAEFVAHAANAYPKLVEALRDARLGMHRALNPVGGDAKCAEIMRLDALLRELGEGA